MEVLCVHMYNAMPNLRVCCRLLLGNEHLYVLMPQNLAPAGNLIEC